ncbi:MAG: biotin/lipoyl-containing protein [Enterococcus faecium]|nr:biotin/lipoyl-containing protein [Clostridioides difficile]MDU6869319.1 biotin/lipoyl-containing protein [Enterococcus faecium]
MDIKQIKNAIELCENVNLNKFKFVTQNGEISFEKNIPIDDRQAISDDIRRVNQNIIDNTKDILSSKEKKVEVQKDIITVKANFVGVIKIQESIKNGKSKVMNGDTLCVIEAMKIYNDICSPADGEITEIFVEDGSVVEYDQELFEIRVNSNGRI